jgi:hypothetical protein
MMFPRICAASAVALCLVGSGQAMAQSPEIAGPATVESFVRGAQGEPFSVEAILQGCGEQDGFSGCILYAEGWRWVAADGAGSNQAAMQVLAGLPVNTPVHMEGDLVFYGDVTAEVVISRIAAVEGGDPHARLRAAMQGDWVSAEDPLSTLQVRGSEETWVYDGEVGEQFIVTFAETCDDSAAPGTFLTKRLLQSADPMVLCYAVESLTPDRMVLMYLPRGNLLDYVRP